MRWTPDPSARRIVLHWPCKGGGRAFVSSAGPVALVLFTQCRAPTEVTLILRTDVPCAQFQGVTVAVGSAVDVESKAPAMTARACDASGQIGSVVLTPSGAKDEEIAIMVVGGDGVAPETCLTAAYGAGCIVARRVLTFRPQAPLTVPIWLRSACAGIACAPLETCVDGACRNARIGDSSACTEPSACGEDELSALDGGTPPDAPTSDTGTDAPDASSGIAFVQANAGGVVTATRATVALNTPVAPHHTTLVAANFFDAGVAGITDTQENTYQVVYPGTPNSFLIAAAYDVAGGVDTVSVALSQQGSVDVYVLEYAGLAPFGFDVGSVSADTTASMQGTVVTTGGPELLLAFGWSNGLISPGAGLTPRSTFNRNLVEDRVLPGPGTYDATATMSNGNSWEMVLATFRGQ